MTPQKTSSTRMINLNPQTTTRTSTQEHAENVQQLLDRIQQLEQEVRDKQFGGNRTPGFRVSPKGGVSVYGIHANFPVTLYADQWRRIEENLPELNNFIENNKDMLDMKEDDKDTLMAKEQKRRAAGIVPRDPRTVRREYISTAANERKVA